MDEEEVTPDHPRATSLRIRAKLAHGFKTGMTSAFGLFAHGRGEAFDYLIGEQTTENATRPGEPSIEGVLNELSIDKEVKIYADCGSPRFLLA